MLSEEGFDLKTLMNASAMQKIAAVRDGANAVCRNQETRTRFELAARNVFRKYKALFPEKQARRYTKQYNAIDAIYTNLNQKVKSADVTEVILRLQQVVDESVAVDLALEPTHTEIDLSTFDMEALRKAFEKVPRKKELVYDLNQAVEQKLEQMLRENPLRLEFYERYREIVDEYNRGKTEADLTRSFTSLTAFIKSLTEEQKRAIHENLDEPTLSIFDLLIQDKELTGKEREEVKKVAETTLEVLQKEKLNIPNWKESREIKAGIKLTIYANLLWLPQEKYSDEDVHLKSGEVYRHIYSYGGFRAAVG